MGPPAIPVRLTPEEMERCWRAGERRYLASRAAGLNPARSEIRTVEEQLADEFTGCRSELSFANWRKVLWDDSPNIFHTRPDVAEADVGSSELHRHHLIVRNNDCLERPFVFVTGVGPVMYLRGWCFGREVFQLGVLKNPGGRRASYFVPPGRLHPMSSYPFPA